MSKAVDRSGFTELLPRSGNATGRGIDSVIQMIGHHQIGAGLGIIADKLGVEPAVFFKAATHRYWIDVPTHGISLELSQHEGDAHDAGASTNAVSADQRHNGWALHSVKLYSTQQTVAAQKTHGVWAQPWPAGIDAERTTVELAEQRLGQDHSGRPTKTDPRISFFRAGLHGTASVIELRFTAALKGITQLYATHLGTTVAWPVEIEAQ